MKAGDYSEEVMNAGIGQELLRDAACVIVISAVFFRTKRKYKKQTYRFILLEAGHVAQNLVLSATDLELGSCTVGSINPKKMGNLIESVDDEKGLYLVAIGHK
jgi:SagB-type dehydrogenase family enzyme